LINNIWVKNKNWKKDLPDFISLKNIKNALELVKKESDEKIFKKEFEEITIENTFEKFLTIFFNEFTRNIYKYEKNTEILWEQFLNLKDFSKDEEKKEGQIEIIKNYLDSSLNIFRMMKYFALEKWRESIESQYDIDDNFYNEFKRFYIDNEIINYYNAFRNYLTKKPYSQDKIKLNFENGTLIDGWDKNKEPNNFGTLLRKNWKYYLALQVYQKKNIFYKKKWSSVIDIRYNII
jgi:CRISPR-associated protein Cpf1